MPRKNLLMLSISMLALTSCCMAANSSNCSCPEDTCGGSSPVSSSSQSAARSELSTSQEESSQEVSSIESSSEESSSTEEKIDDMPYEEIDAPVYYEAE